MAHRRDIKPEKWIALGIPAIFLSGAALHYLYAWSGKSVFAAPLAPVNESIWEHTKMAYIPAVAWWWGGYKKYRDKIDADRWFSGGLAALLACIAVMPMGYYSYTGVLGKRICGVDISLLALAAAAGQALGGHIYKHGKGRPGRSASAVLTAAVGGVFALLTFCTPHLPLFKDNRTGRYGIRQDGDCHTGK